MTWERILKGDTIRKGSVDGDWDFSDRVKLQSSVEISITGHITP